MLIVAPIAAMLLQLGISRQREYQADASGAKMVGHQYGLISALEKLGAYNKRIPMDISPSTSALCIVAPLNAGQHCARAFQHASTARGPHRAACKPCNHALIDHPPRKYAAQRRVCCSRSGSPPSNQIRFST